MKICKRCGEIKPLNDYYPHKATSDGYLGNCKECCKIAARKNREENIDRFREYDKLRASKPHRKIQRESLVKIYNAEYPERRKANTAVNNAVRDGRLEKWHCMVCGNKKSVGHHADYDRPLDVIWLCQAHHKQAHALVKDK